MTDASSSDGSERAGPPDPAANPELLRIAAEAAGEAIIITTPDLEQPGPIIVYVNPAFTRMTGYTREEAVGRSPRFLQGPGTDRATLDRLHVELASGGPFHGETLNCRKDGGHYLISWLITPMHDAAGQISHWIAIQRDITDLRRKEERLREVAAHRTLLLGELQQRVQHTLAAVRTMARRTGDTSLTAEDYAAHLDGRLNALTRVLTMITRDPSAGISLEHLVAEELLANVAHEGEQTSISGPDVLLQPGVAETFGLALHELATNAIKYGALSAPGGRVAVRWWIESADTDAPPHLVFDWVETGNQRPVPAPRPRGFGMSLLEDQLPHELEAETRLAFTPQGFSCRITLPLMRRLVRLADDIKVETSEEH